MTTTVGGFIDVHIPFQCHMKGVVDSTVGDTVAVVRVLVGAMRARASIGR